jgi:hypothetical protein
MALLVSVIVIAAARPRIAFHDGMNHGFCFSTIPE